MIQSEDFTFHHDKTLERHHIMVDITNETRQVSFSKRLYFNKPSLPLGFIELRPRDRLKVGFIVVQNSGSDEEKKELI
jgi:hypothetical protein